MKLQENLPSFQGSMDLQMISPYKLVAMHRSLILQAAESWDTALKRGYVNSKVVFESIENMDRQWKYHYQWLACFSLNTNLVMTVNISHIIQVATVADLRQVAQRWHGWYT